MSGPAAFDDLAPVLDACGATDSERRGRTLGCRLPREAVRRAAADLTTRNFDLDLMLAADRRADRRGFELRYLFGDAAADRFVELAVDVPAAEPRFPSIATLSYPASRYEREIRDQFGLTPDGHPDPRPLVRHGFWPEDYYPLRKDAPPPGAWRDDGQPFPFRRVEGEGVYEIPVGPVHAGIIEPGHFRFSADGETIVDMKARLYFTHKGTEKLFEGRRPMEGVALAERIAGDTAVGHPLAYCQAIEALAGIEPPPRAAHARVILLELERLYNHVTDFGAIANDTGFAIAQTHAARIRELLLRANARLTGHRLMRGMLRPGGLERDLDDVDRLPAAIDRLRADFDDLVAICLDNSMLVDRLRGAGRLTRRTALDHGAVGPVARASGIDRDVRRDHPFAAYGGLTFRVPVLEAGDVEARTMLRVEEVRESAGLIAQAVAALRGGALACPLPPLPAGQGAFGLVEGWRGGIIHWALAGAGDRLDRVKIKDPSFVNWRPLTFALLKNIVPDFPLCNKSFNLSYSGNDL